MIIVAGEALFDVLAGDERSLIAHPGGAPFNVARFLARLGGEAMFLGALSDDGFGDVLRTTLRVAGVAIAASAPVNAPTTLALATLDPAGAADYRIYLDGTSAAALTAAMLPDGLLAPVVEARSPSSVPPPRRASSAFVFGGLGLVGEPCASTLVDLVGRLPGDVMVVLDPNCRPRAIGDPAAYRARIDSLLSRVDVLKVSVEDVAFLRPGVATADAARELAASGPSAVFVTDGGKPLTLLAAGGQAMIPVPRAEVVDTIGAGDAFVAGFVAWWSARGLSRSECRAPSPLHQAARAALEVSAAVCGCAGAELPADFRWSASV